MGVGGQAGERWCGGWEQVRNRVEVLSGQKGVRSGREEMEQPSPVSIHLPSVAIWAVQLSSSLRYCPLVQAAPPNPHQGSGA